MKSTWKKAFIQLLIFTICTLCVLTQTSCGKSKNRPSSASALLQMPNVIGMALPDAYTALLDAGFLRSGIQIDPSGVSRSDKSWRVESLNYEVGSLVNQSDIIQLFCTSFIDSYSNVLVGKSVLELQEYAEQNNITLSFLNYHKYDTIEKIVDVMSQPAKKDWVVVGIISATRDKMNVVIKHNIDVDRILSGYEITYRTSNSKMSSHHVLLNFKEQIYTNISFKYWNGKNSISSVSTGRLYGDKETGWRLSSEDSVIHYEYVEKNGKMTVLKYNSSGRAEEVSYTTDTAYMIEELRKEIAKMDTDEISLTFTPRH